MNQIVCLDSEPADMGDIAWDSVRAHGNLVLYPRTDTAERVVERAKDADIIITNKVPITASILAQLPKLKMIAVLATGYNHIDLDAASAKNITVTNLPGYSTASTAQTSIALLLELTHGIGNHANAVRTGQWSRSPNFAFWQQPLIELDGRTMVIFGFGAIGKRVGAIAEALGMHVIPAQVPGRPESADRMATNKALAQADVVSLHCPLTDNTRHMINASSLAKMKRGTLLINTGRGPLIHDQHVLDALHSGQLGGYAADVMSAEPPPANHPLLLAPRTILSPHIGWASFASRQRAASWTGESIGAFLQGNPIRVVTAPSPKRPS